MTRSPVYDLPVIGPWTAKTGHVIDILSTPCAITPTVMIKAAWHATPRLLIALTKPDRYDLVTKRWGGGHKRRSKRRFKVIDELVSEIPVPKNKISAAIFNLGNWAQRIGWYMLVVDATETFAIEWTSAAYQWSGCQTPGAPYCNMNIVGHGPMLPYEAGAHIINIWDLISRRIYSGDGNSISTTAGTEQSFGVGIQTQPVPPGFKQASLSGGRIIDLVTDRTIADLTEVTLNDGHQYLTTFANLWGGAEPGRNCAVEIVKSEGYYDIGGSTFQAYGSRDIGFLADP